MVEQKLQAMLQSNPQRMDYYRKHQEIIADYNREKDRVTVEETLVRLVQLAEELDAEQRRAVEEGLSEDEPALFDLLGRENITKADRERLKQASRDLLKRLQELLRTMEQWTQNAQTHAEVERFILDHLYTTLPRPPFTEEETQEIAGRVYEFVWEQCAAGVFSPAAWIWRGPIRARKASGDRYRYPGPVNGICTRPKGRQVDAVEVNKASAL